MGRVDFEPMSFSDKDIAQRQQAWDQSISDQKKAGNFKSGRMDFSSRLTDTSRYPGPINLQQGQDTRRKMLRDPRSGK